MNTKAFFAVIVTLGLLLTMFSERTYAQGTVLFQNTSSNLVTTNDLAGDTGPATAVSGILVQLYYQPDTNGNAPSPITTNCNCSGG
jgi:hypothetical protein